MPATRSRRSLATGAANGSTKAAATASKPSPGKGGKGRKVKVEEERDDGDAVKENVKSHTPTKKKVKVEKEEEDDWSGVPATPSPKKRGRSSGGGRPKKEEGGDDVNGAAADSKEDVKPSPAKTLAERKLNSHRSAMGRTPFPRWPLPTHEEAEKVAWLLGRSHGYKPESEGGRGLPKFTPPQGEDKLGGCGDVKDVMEATIRTILSCNTSGRNSAAAHQGLIDNFGNRNWKAILNAPQKDVEEAIRCGGLAVNKSKSIQGLLRDTQERYGELSLQFLHDRPSTEILETLMSFSGVGPKVASCVLAFCLGRPSLAVDTHVHRLSVALGWVPPKANREQTYYHLNVRVQEKLMYPIHVLLIKHGKVCPNCKAKGGGLGKAAKWVSSDEEDGAEEEEDSKEHLTEGQRQCPLKQAGLLSKRNLKLLPEEGEEDEK